MAILSTDIVRKSLEYLADKMELPFSITDEKMESYWEDLRDYPIEHLRDGVRWIIRPLDKKVFLSNRTRLPSVMDIHESIRLALEWHKEDRKTSAREMVEAYDKNLIDSWLEQNKRFGVNKSDIVIAFRADRTRDGRTAKALSLINGKTAKDLGLIAIQKGSEDDPATPEQKAHWTILIWRESMGKSSWFPAGYEKPDPMMPEECVKDHERQLAYYFVNGCYPRERIA